MDAFDIGKEEPAFRLQCQYHICPQRHIISNFTCNLGHIYSNFQSDCSQILWETRTMQSFLARVRLYQSVFIQVSSKTSLHFFKHHPSQPAFKSVTDFFWSCFSKTLNRRKDTKKKNVAPHRDPSVFSFLEVSSETAYVGSSYGPYRTLNNFRLNPNTMACWDRTPRNPRAVPWDQKFGLKKFLTSSSNELILWVLWIGYAKNAKNQEKLLILAWFLSNKGKSWKWPKMNSFPWFLAFLA